MLHEIDKWLLAAAVIKSAAAVSLARPQLGMGIPNRDDYGNFDNLKPGGMYNYFIQRHLAKRAGPHYDVRFGNPETGLYSFATKKGPPAPGGHPIALFQQPVHAYSYGGFSGTLGSGYGTGTVNLVRQGKVLVTAIDKKAIHFATADGHDIKRFTLVRPKQAGDKRWLAIHDAPPESTGLTKKHYKLIAPEEADAILEHLESNAAVQPKVDGAMVYARLRKDRMDILSHRTSKRTGQPIVHTERFFGGKNPRFDFPKKYRGAVLLAEMHGFRNGHIMPAQELGGILNSGLDKSLDTQKARKIDLKGMLYGVGSMPGQDVKNLTHAQQRSMLEEIQPYLPPGKFTLPEEAHGGAEAKELLRKIRSGEHHLTHEGVVIYPSEPGAIPMKVKPTTEHDVVIRDIFPGGGRLAGHSAGGFHYSLSPGDQAIAGKVGTGFDDDTRRDMLRNPDQWIGRTAKIQAQEQFPSGAYRAPVFHSLHEDVSQV